MPRSRRFGARRSSRRIRRTTRRVRRAAVKRRPAARRGRRGKSTIGGLIAKGVKSLVASIPVVGSTLANIADFAFKNVALSADLATCKISGNYIDIGNSNLSSLVAKFSLTPAAVLSGSAACIVTGSKKIISQYKDGRVTSLTIRAMPTGIASGRAGDWHMGFQPFYEKETTLKPSVGELGIKHMAKSASGPACKPLTVSFVPKASDGRVFQFMPLTESYGYIAIRFDKYDRNPDDYPKQFSVGDFACEVKISGTIETRLCDTDEVQPTEITQFVIDNLKSIGGIIEIGTTGYVAYGLPLSDHPESIREIMHVSSSLNACMMEES